jgi:hypothetical protein
MGPMQCQADKGQLPFEMASQKGHEDSARILPEHDAEATT